MNHFFTNENLLNIDNQTEAVMARYSVDGSKAAVLILLQYPDVDATIDAYNAFKHRFPTDPGLEFTVDTDQLWTGCFRNNNLLIIIVDAPSLKTAQRLVQGVQ